MVESKKSIQADIPATQEYFKILVMLRGVFQFEFLPFLTKGQIIRLHGLNKACYALIDPRQAGSVSYKVLYEAWGYILTEEQEELAKRSLLGALTCCPESLLRKSGLFIVKV